MNKPKPQNESEHASNTAQIDSTDRQYLDMQQIRTSEINAINQQIRISELDAINQRMQALESSHDVTGSGPQSPNCDHQNSAQKPAQKPAQNSVQNPVQNPDSMPR